MNWFTTLNTLFRIKNEDTVQMQYQNLLQSGVVIADYFGDKGKDRELICMEKYRVFIQHIPVM